MKRKYEIAEHVWGEVVTAHGPVSFDFEPGVRAPANEDEEEVLQYLVETGQAAVTTSSTAKKGG